MGAQASRIDKKSEAITKRVSEKYTPIILARKAQKSVNK